MGNSKMNGSVQALAQAVSDVFEGALARQDEKVEAMLDKKFDAAFDRKFTEHLGDLSTAVSAVEEALTQVRGAGSRG